MDRYTEALKLLRGPSRKLTGQGRRFWSVAAVAIVLSALAVYAALRQPGCWSWFCLRAGEMAELDERRSAAVDWYGSALEVDRDNPVVIERLGIALERAGRERDAIPVFERLHSIRQSRGTGIAHLTQVHLKAGNFKKALMYSAEWLTLKPTSDLAFRCRGRAYEGLGKYEEALADYNQSLSLNARSEAIIDKEQLLQRGRIKHHTFEAFTEPTFENNAVDYKAVLRDSVRKFMALQPDEAIQEIDKAVKLDADSPLAYYLRGLYKLSCNRYKPALVDLKAADERWKEGIKLDLGKPPAGMGLPGEFRGTKARLYNDLAMTYYNLGDYREALVASNKAIALNASVAKFFHVRSAIYHKLGLKKNGKEDFLSYRKMVIEESAHPDLGSGNFFFMP